MAHGTEAQRRVFALREFGGQWSGTMCLSEPQAGSSLSDVATRAVPDGDDFAADPLGPRYRLSGNKMWISAGEHELTENIIHLVLAKIPGADGKTVAGTRGISLFVVPKHLVDADGELTGARNDVVLAGLNHKCGWRGTTNTLLNFGEGRFKPNGRPGALGYLVGAPGEGLRCMFHMMNEALQAERPAGRARLPGRCAGRRLALHVPHDERGADRRRHGSDDARHGRLRGIACVRAPAPARPAADGGGQEQRGAAGADHRPRRRQADAAGAEGVRGGCARARALLRAAGGRAA
jgi:hypothetical protein